MVGFVKWHTAIRLVVTLCYLQAQALGALDSRRSICNNQRVQPNQIKSEPIYACAIQNINNEPIYICIHYKEENKICRLTFFYE